MSVTTTCRDVGTVGNQQFDCVQAAIAGGIVEGRVVLEIPGIDVGTVRHQQFCQLIIALADCDRSSIF